ncbi:MAG: DegQ family serine endoprotease [Myxococcota bacterium]|jgi:serine protease Do|nr:DegQ family serine endoprotease [Myxococcota bacterium]
MRRSISFFWTAVACALAVGLFATAIPFSSSDGTAGADVSRVPGRSPRTLAPTPGEDLIADIAEGAVDSVVNISSEKVIQMQGRPNFGPFSNDPFFRRFFEGLEGPRNGRGLPRERRESSLGSGVIVDREGTILTNNHVIEQADKVRVTLADGRSFDAEVVGTDPQSDIGVLRLEDPPHDLKPLPFGDSDKLRLGSTVLAIGNPFGVGQTVTMGIVSAKGRANVGIVDYEDFIQTDAAINPGNSGGALVNTAGELVGINTAILSRTGGYQGIGFAIPSNMADRIMSSLVDHGKVVRGWLGVMIQDLTPDLVRALDLPEDTQGALISDVVDDSPAAEGGLEAGDVVIGMEGNKIDSSAKLRNQVAIAPAGEKVQFQILRDGRKKKLKVKLGERDGEPVARSKTSSGGAPLGGLSLATATRDLARRFGLDESVEGLVVTGVEPGSAAAHSGFRPGDVVVEVDRKPVDSIRAFEKVYDASHDAVAVLVQRGEGRLFIVFEKQAD